MFSVNFQALFAWLKPGCKGTGEGKGAISSVEFIPVLDVKRKWRIRMGEAYGGDASLLRHAKRRFHECLGVTCGDLN